MRISTGRILGAMAAVGVLATATPAQAQSAHSAQQPMTKAAVAQPAAAKNGAAAAGLRKLYDERFTVKPNNGHYPGLKVSPAKAMKSLHDCFNCSFPVKGAPKKFPKENQRLNLEACATFFACKDAPVRYHGIGTMKNAWYFTAEKGHFDGKGSKVYFNFYTDSKGYLKLHVEGYVTHPSVPDSLNKRFAVEKWQNFAHNMGTKLD
ncbi:hypothetical protein OG754_16725 [Streptomyces decoyicus]|uniref:hypothetical protein n=1 Tax=Streptomyces decoyicus TaxID=249567 RepID=UPI002E3777A4|nr:hypothetical protein [Streptomyces decoyicus]